MQFNQLLVSASPHDAITNAALELRAILRKTGPSNVYARHIERSLSNEVLPLGRYYRRASADPDSDVLIFHASIGEPDIVTFISHQPGRLVLLYHNISPPDAFRLYDPGFAGLLEAGRNELVALKDRAVLALAVSEYNARELRELGYRDVRVSPLVVERSRLASLPDDAELAAELDAEEGPLVLFVGQLLPHKRPDLLLKAFHILVTHIEPSARLAMVGLGRLGEYRRALYTFSDELNLDRVRFMGSVTDSKLATLFRRASVFATASEHEGFCVPLVEAMSFDVPIVARACAAVPETVADAGLLVDPDDGPAVFAEALDCVTADPAVREELVRRGRRRLTELDPERARATFVQHLLTVA